MKRLIIRVARVACVLALTALFPSTGAQPASGLKPKTWTDTPADAAACKVRLTKIYEALKAYQQKYRKLPNWLSDLHPDFIDDPNLLICPYVESLGDFQTWRDNVRGEVFFDPGLPISYAYEFNIREYKLPEGASTTVREFKKRQVSQMGLWAAEVPVVRCLAHHPILNLSLGGKIYESDIDWEDKYADVVDVDDLSQARLFTERPVPEPPTQSPVVVRDPKLTPKAIDLSPFFTAFLTESWQGASKPGNDLRNLPQGAVTFPNIGVPFDVRGVVQLRGKSLANFKSRVDGINARQHCKQIHFLHATSFAAEAKQEIGHYEIHYVDQQQRTVPIIYDQDVLDWWFNPTERERSGPQTAWVGLNRAAQAEGRRLRLFHTAWPNPLPDLEVESISFVSALGPSAPFLIAITLE